MAEAAAADKPRTMVVDFLESQRLKVLKITKKIIVNDLREGQRH